MGLIQALFRAFRVVGTPRSVPSAELLCLQEICIEKAPGEKLGISIRGGAKGHAGNPFDPTDEGIFISKVPEQQQQEIPGGAGVCSELSLLHHFWRLSLQHRTKSLSFHISSSTAAQIIILFPACLILLCGFFFFCNANPHIFLSLCPHSCCCPCACACCPLGHESSFPPAWKASGMGFLSSLLPLCVTLFLFWVTACVTHTSHTAFPPEMFSRST